MAGGGRQAASAACCAHSDLEEEECFLINIYLFYKEHIEIIPSLNDVVNLVKGSGKRPKVPGSSSPGHGVTCLGKTLTADFELFKNLTCSPALHNPSQLDVGYGSQCA